MVLEEKLKVYYLTAILSLIFAVIGFSYNAWRLELSEDNNNVRTAAFEVLKELSELERIIYASYYDKNEIEGSPRKGWVKVGLISDLSMLISYEVKAKSEALKQRWAENWETLPSDQAAADLLVVDIDKVRAEIKGTLSKLR